MEKHDEAGYEYFDPTPIELPLGFKRPEPLADMLKRLVHNELSADAAAKGKETFEEADDFEVEEDPDPLSYYQVRDMEQEELREERRRGKEAQRVRDKARKVSEANRLSGKDVPAVGSQDAGSGKDVGGTRFGRRSSDQARNKDGGHGEGGRSERGSDKGSFSD